MNYEIEHLHADPEEEQLAIAQLIEDYTHGKLDETPQMLPVTVAEVMSKHIALRAKVNNTFAGFIGAISPVARHNQPMSEIGTLWVPKTFRGNGIAFNLIKAAQAELAQQGITSFAFGNPGSEPIFKAAGFSIALCSELPTNVFEACANCPAKPLTGCCDQPLIYRENQ